LLNLVGEVVGGILVGCGGKRKCSRGVEPSSLSRVSRESRKRRGVE
jgi:hypothetical protein